ncbi:5-(carboxyamino)imidazole ribonucleotide synthase [Nesterenkonia xinjiangensis]|uniref:N5-carboxyaminoimidazole ribonucleotide synthase n=1 Tax=Nesterenkonia xinjiangensis TaxID=225327 RepID=A0A7Z0GKZ6_9MICC|nr:5-(carboxyamino)imidazole ribonucleotide synthase [Nesterenkonia xinjiangensis]
MTPAEAHSSVTPPHLAAAARGDAPRVGVLGDGQLARMMAPAAVELGIELRLLASSADSSAGQVIPRTTLGDYRSVADVLGFAGEVDVITFDHEHVPAEVLTALIDQGTALHPGPEALHYAQDKLAMRRAVEELGLPNPRWAEVHSVEELIGFGEETGWPVVLKTSRGGYDGKGVRIIASAETAVQAQDWFDRAAAQHTGLLAEEKVPFTRELSAQVARSALGEIRAYPVVESNQAHGVCDEVIAPAPHSHPTHMEDAASIARLIAERLAVTGMLAVELFEIAEGERAGVYVNELAMRPHNSGHWSMDGAVTGQFEQHLRAVLGLPLGSTAPIAGPGSRTVMKNLFGASAPNLHAGVPDAARHLPESRIHLYGKEPRPGRKVGHVNLVLAPEPGEPAVAAGELQRARQAAARAAELITETTAARPHHDEGTGTDGR